MCRHVVVMIAFFLHQLCLILTQVEAKEREKENINSNSEAKQKNNRSFQAKGDGKILAIASKEDAYVFKEEEEEDFEPSFRSLKKGRRKSHALKETQCSQEKRRVKSAVHNDGEERRLGPEENLKASDKQALEEKPPGEKNVASETTKTAPEDQVKVSEHGGSEDSRAKAGEGERINEDKPPGSVKTKEADHPLSSQKEGKDIQVTVKG